jgi:hypothetical protein
MVRTACPSLVAARWGATLPGGDSVDDPEQAPTVSLSPKNSTDLARMFLMSLPFLVLMFMLPSVGVRRARS